MTIYQGANFFVTNRAGSLADTGTTLPWSKEPTGVGYNAANKHLFVSDDSQLEVFEDAPGGDGRYGTGDDVVTHFDTAVFGSGDPEGVEYEAPSNSVWIADGVNREVYRVRAGSDGRFGTTDDVRSHFDTAQYGTGDPEGMAYDSVRDTLLVLDGASPAHLRARQDRRAAQHHRRDLRGHAQRGRAHHRAQQHRLRAQLLRRRPRHRQRQPPRRERRPPLRDHRLAARHRRRRGQPGPLGQCRRRPDAWCCPRPRRWTAPSTTTACPTHPAPTTTTWTKASGPGTVTFANASATDTTATFSDAGTYVLRLTAQDGALSTSDEVTVLVQTSTCGSGGTVQSARRPDRGRLRRRRAGP